MRRSYEYQIKKIKIIRFSSIRIYFAVGLSDRIKAYLEKAKLYDNQIGQIGMPNGYVRNGKTIIAHQPIDNRLLAWVKYVDGAGGAFYAFMCAHINRPFPGT